MNFEEINVLQVMTVAVAGAWAFMLVQWVTFIRQYLAVTKDIIPANMDFTDREAVLKLVASLDEKSLIHYRLRSLLETWSRGASHIDIVEMAASQSSRGLARAWSSLIFSVLVLVGGLALPALSDFAAAGLGVAGATAFLYLLVLGRIDAFIERHLLDRLPGQIEGLKITADELARSLGGAIEKAFRECMPQPEKLAAATTAAVEATLKSAAGSLDGMHRKLLDMQEGIATKLAALQKDSASAVEASIKKSVDSSDALTVKWAASQKDVIASSEASLRKILEVQQAIAEKQAASQKEAIAGTDASHVKLIEGQQAVAEKQAASQREMLTQLESVKKSMDEVAAKLDANLAGSAEKWQAALQAHAQQVTAANQALAAQLEKIQAMGKEIEKVLHIQQTVDNTIRSVTTTEDFRNTLATLKSHLEKSDSLLREVTKPRTIRLVESSPELH